MKQESKNPGQQRAAKPNPPLSVRKQPGKSYTLEPIHNSVNEHNGPGKGSTRVLWVIDHGAGGGG